MRSDHQKDSGADLSIEHVGTPSDVVENDEISEDDKRKNEESSSAMLDDENFRPSLDHIVIDTQKLSVIKNMICSVAEMITTEMITTEMITTGDHHRAPLDTKTSIDGKFTCTVIDPKKTVSEPSYDFDLVKPPDIVIIDDDQTIFDSKPASVTSTTHDDVPEIVMVHESTSDHSRTSSFSSSDSDSNQNIGISSSLMRNHGIHRLSETTSCSRSTSVSSYDSQDTALATSPVGSFSLPPEFPMTPIKVEVASMTVHEGGTGVHHGDSLNFTLNQFIGVIPGEKGRKTIDPKVMEELVTDAVKINTQTKQQFFEKDRSYYKFLGVCFGSKEDMAKAQKRFCFLLLGVVIFVSFIPLASTALYSYLNTSYNSVTPQPVDDTDDFADMPGAPRIFSRSYWLAQPPMGVLDNNTLPVKTVIVCHTATEGCFTTPDCVRDVRYIQQFHIESRKWFDIGYSFLIGGDGNVYEARGWDKMGAHTKGHNNGTLGIAFIGTYSNQLPSDEMIDAFNRLVNLGVQVGKISANYSLVAQCQLTSTAAPGLTLARNMSSWPHYDASLPVRCTAV